MSAMANVTPIIATIKNASVKEKTLKEADAVPKASILDFHEEHYEDILSIIMDRARYDKRKESGPSRASTRDPSHSRGRSLNRNRPQIRDRLRGVEESYDDAYSSYGTETKYRDRSNDRDHSCSIKRWRESESPPSRRSESSTSNRRHWKSKAKRHKPTRFKKTCMVVPWTCEDVDPFIPRIYNFKSSQKTRMPNNVKTYDGTGDPEDHLKIFQAAAQRDGETIEEFIERFKIKTGCMKGAPKCMRISGFMHGVNNPELTKCLNEHVPKTVEEMMTATTAFILEKPPPLLKRKFTLLGSHRTSPNGTPMSGSDF
ncbi:hypothetical protein Tco_1421520 [Tanacetum coccineum]